MRSTMPWMPGAAPSIAGNASTNEVDPRCQSLGAAAPTTPGTVLSFAAICSALPPLLDEHVERLHHAGADAGRGELVASGDRRPGAGEVLQLGLVRVQLRAQPGERGDDDEPDQPDRDGAPDHEPGPASPARRPPGGRGR